MSKINILYSKYSGYPDVMVSYEQIKSAIIDPNEKQYFQVYVDLFRTLQRKPTLDEFNIELITRGANNMSIEGGSSKRRRIRKSKRRKSRKSKRRRGTRRK